MPGDGEETASERAPESVARELGIGFRVGCERESERAIAVAAIDPIAAACALHERFDVCDPGPVPLDAMAASQRAYTIYDDAGGADALVLRGGHATYFIVARAHEGTDRARFSIAHELAHVILHPGVDAIARLHGRARPTPRELEMEEGANRFASALLLPRALLARFATMPDPRVEDVARAGRVFATSLSATMKAWVEVTGAPCAMVASCVGKITEVAVSPAFRGVAEKFGTVEHGTGARAIATGAVGRDGMVTRVHGAKWGAEGAGAEIVEESVAVRGSDVVLTWLWHAKGEAGASAR